MKLHKELDRWSLQGTSEELHKLNDRLSALLVTADAKHAEFVKLQPDRPDGMHYIGFFLDEVDGWEWLDALDGPKEPA